MWKHWDFHKRTSAFLLWLLRDHPLYSPTAQHSVKQQGKQQRRTWQCRREACVSPAQNRFTLEACPLELWLQSLLMFLSSINYSQKVWVESQKEVSGSWRQRLSPGHVFRDPGIQPLSACLCGLCYLTEAGLPVGASREHRGSGTSFQGLFLARDDSRNLCSTSSSRSETDGF